MVVYTLVNDELTANPVEHFQFLYWSDSSSETNPVRTFNIPADIQSSSIEAIYTAIEYDIAVSNETSLGDVLSAATDAPFTSGTFVNADIISLRAPSTG